MYLRNIVSVNPSPLVFFSSALPWGTLCAAIPRSSILSTDYILRDISSGIVHPTTIEALNRLVLPTVSHQEAAYSREALMMMAFVVGARRAPRRVDRSHRWILAWHDTDPKAIEALASQHLTAAEDRASFSLLQSRQEEVGESLWKCFGGSEGEERVTREEVLAAHFHVRSKAFSFPTDTRRFNGQVRPPPRTTMGLAMAPVIDRVLHGTGEHENALFHPLLDTHLQDQMGSQSRRFRGGIGLSTTAHVEEGQPLRMDFRDVDRAVMLSKNYTRGTWLWTFGVPRPECDDVFESDAMQTEKLKRVKKHVRHWMHRKKGDYVSGVPEGIQYLRESRERVLKQQKERQEERQEKLL